MVSFFMVNKMFAMKATKQTVQCEILDNTWFIVLFYVNLVGKTWICKNTILMTQGHT